MESGTAKRISLGIVSMLWAMAWAGPGVTGASAAQSTSVPAAVESSTGPDNPEFFASPEKAASALVAAAEKFDVTTLMRIFGPVGRDIVATGDFVQDRKNAKRFAAEAKEKTEISRDPKRGNRAFLLVGNENWPFPVPIVKRGQSWYFDSRTGIQELKYRRIGENELDAIDVCRGYVEAQHSYALQPRQGYDVNQYAQKIVSAPGKQDGLAWQNPDGTWGGPVGERIAQAIAEGLTPNQDPYHGYFFKILKRQGPAAPLGQMDFVVQGVMIGGFALVAAPAEYGVTGVKAFMVSHDGVVYEKDLGPNTLEEFNKMDRFNPDASWKPVEDTEGAPSRERPSVLTGQD